MEKNLFDFLPEKHRMELERERTHSMKIRFVLCDNSFRAEALQDSLRLCLRRYLGPTFHNLEIEFVDTVETSDLLLLATDALIVAPEEYKERWQTVAQACGMGFLVLVRSENQQEAERARALGAKILGRKMVMDEFALELANLFRYFEDRVGAWP